MYTLIRGFFVTLGIIFFCGIVTGSYFIIADPYNIRPMVQLLWKASHSSVTTVGQPTSDTPVTTDVTAHSSSSVVSESQSSSGAAEAEVVPAITVNAAQAEALKSIGLDPSFISTITPAQESCFVTILGAARVASIKAGAVPSASEFFSVRSCL